MKIIQFKGKDLHGYLDLSVDFNTDLTFITGINGSGKTSVVKGISSLISPSLVALAHTDYSKMELLIEENDRKTTIWSEKSDGQIRIGSSVIGDTLKINLFPEDEIVGPRSKERVIDYYEELEVLNSDHQIMKFIRDLPTPMVLGIDRRTRDLFESDRVISRPRTTKRRRNNIFRTSLSESLDEAIGLAQRKYRDIEFIRGKFTENLRQQIVESALTYEDRPDYMDTPRPSKLDLQRIESIKSTASKILTEIGLDQEFVNKQLDTFFNKLRNLTRRLPENADFDSIDPEKSPELVNAMIEYMINRPQFDRIVKILQLVESHIKDIQNVRDPILRYLDSINSFFLDANKTLMFNESGDLSIQFKQESMGPIGSLSSGECQLVVILTHLALNPDAKRANVFIVDEPELSLHVKWQEEFVSAIQNANPNLQLILATHSPSIILDRTEYCVDLSEKI
ncbi:MAG: AAA family ATPase [Thermodesulfobacteriota bacterium]